MDAWDSARRPDATMPLPDSQLGQEPVASNASAARHPERAAVHPRTAGGRALTSSGEIAPPRREKPGELGLRNGFQPLSNLPQGVPRRWRAHWRKLAGRAATSYRAAVELKCLDCCAWQRTEARRCEIRGCPLWAVSKRIFGTCTRSEARRE